MATARAGRLLGTKGSTRLAERAARDCLEQAGRRAEDLDLLLNVGVYHENNLGEPALAALIQHDIGATQRTTEPGRHGTFSFDVQNGGAGVVTAMYLLNGFLDSAIELGMVVASDADPGSRIEPEFPFAPVGGAALLARGSGDEQGFVAFQHDTYPEFEHLVDARIAWRDHRIGRGENVLAIDIHPGFADRAVDCAVESTRRFLDRVDQSPDGVDLFIASQWPPTLCDRVGERIGVSGDRVARIGEELSGVHTAGPLAALAAAQRDGRWAQSKTILILAVGAGINCALALYRK